MTDTTSTDEQRSISKIEQSCLSGLIDNKDSDSWKDYVIRGLLTEIDIDYAIYKRQNGYPKFTFIFMNTFANEEGTR